MKLDNYKNMFKSTFSNSYGWDKFSSLLAIIGLMLLFSKWTVVFGLASIGYGIYRTFSKSITKRQFELKVFNELMQQFSNKATYYKKTVLDFPKYKIFKCPNCSQKLRIPRGKGKVMISCKKCGKEFQGKS